MAEQRRIEEIAVANFDLLGDSDDFNELILDGEVTQQELEAVEGIVAQAQVEKNSETQDSLDDFEEAATIQRHASANEEKLDFYAAENHKDTTKRQTKWAVNLFTGKSILFSQISCKFYQIKSCSRRQNFSARWTRSTLTKTCNT